MPHITVFQTKEEHASVGFGREFSSAEPFLQNWEMSKTKHCKDSGFLGMRVTKGERNRTGYRPLAHSATISTVQTKAFRAERYQTFDDIEQSLLLTIYLVPAGRSKSSFQLLSFVEKLNLDLKNLDNEFSALAGALVSALSRTTEQPPLGR
jgi:hypothetical protein